MAPDLAFRPRSLEQKDWDMIFLEDIDLEEVPGSPTIDCQ